MILTDSPVTPYSTKTESCLASQFLGELRLVDEEVISGYVSTLCTKFCALDAIPSSVFQRGQDRLGPIITRIVNLSLQGGQVPDRFKVGVIKPLLKKIGADHENFSIFGQYRICIFYLKSREEKSLRHVAMVAKFLDDNKPKTSLKKWIHTVTNFIDLIQFHLICQMLAKFSGVKSERIMSKLTKKEKKIVKLCSPTQQSRRMKLETFMPQSCNDGWEMYKKEWCTCKVLFCWYKPTDFFAVLVAVAVVVA